MLPVMSTDTQEVLRICERLPERERAEDADFARFLLAKSEATNARSVEQWRRRSGRPPRAGRPIRGRDSPAVTRMPAADANSVQYGVTLFA